MSYFTNKDFKNATPPCDISDMDKELIKRLNVARVHSGTPYIVNSAYRTVEHELSKGRDGRSAHTLGKAVDIRATTPRERAMILIGLVKAGFNRIGIYDTFIHADIATTSDGKDEYVVW